MKHSKIIMGILFVMCIFALTSCNFYRSDAVAAFEATERSTEEDGTAADTTMQYAFYNDNTCDICFKVKVTVNGFSVTAKGESTGTYALISGDLAGDGATGYVTASDMVISFMGIEISTTEIGTFGIVTNSGALHIADYDTSTGTLGTVDDFAITRVK